MLRHFGDDATEDSRSVNYQNYIFVIRFVFLSAIHGSMGSVTYSNNQVRWCVLCSKISDNQQTQPASLRLLAGAAAVHPLWDTRHCELPNLWEHGATSLHGRGQTKHQECGISDDVSPAVLLV